MTYCPGWLDPRTIEGPFTRIAPYDYSMISINGKPFQFDSAQMGWEFYYSMAKAAYEGVELNSISHPPGWEFRIKGFLDRVRKRDWKKTTV